MLDKVVAEIIQEKKGLSSEAVAGLLNGKKGKPLGTLAVEKGLPTEEELLTSLNQKLRVPSVKDLEGEYSIVKAKIFICLIQKEPVCIYSFIQTV